MGIKENLLISVQAAKESAQVWMDQVQLLARGKETHLVQTPVNHEDSKFGIWLDTEGHILTSFPEYKNISVIHEGFHEAYKEVYKRAKEVFDAESHKKLQNATSRFEGQFILFSSKLESLESAFKQTPDNILEEYAAKKNIDARLDMGSVGNKEVEELKVSPETHKDESIQNIVIDSVKNNSIQLSLGSSEAHKRLKEQDLLQIELEQKLTEQELSQLEERLLLTNQGVIQITQYQELKKQEADKQMNEYLLQEANNYDERETNCQSITKLVEDILVKERELVELALVDKKLGNKKKKRIEEEQKIHDTFARELKSNTESIIQLDEQQKKWEDEAEELKQKLLLVERNLIDLSKQKIEKQSLIDRSDEMKQLQIDELTKYYKKQEDINNQKTKIRELKQAELSELEKKLASREKRADDLEIDAKALKAKKESVSLKYEQDLKQLDEQQTFKRKVIERLEKEKLRKNIELKELSSQKEALQNSLREDEECSKSPEPKKLEEV